MVSRNWKSTTKNCVRGLCGMCWILTMVWLPNCLHWPKAVSPCTGKGTLFIFQLYLGKPYSNVSYHPFTVSSYRRRCRLTVRQESWGVIPSELAAERGLKKKKEKKRLGDSDLLCTFSHTVPQVHVLLPLLDSNFLIS